MENKGVETNELMKIPSFDEILERNNITLDQHGVCTVRDPDNYKNSIQFSRNKTHQAWFILRNWVKKSEDRTEIFAARKIRYNNDGTWTVSAGNKDKKFSEPQERWLQYLQLMTLVINKRSETKAREGITTTTGDALAENLQA